MAQNSVSRETSTAVRSSVSRETLERLQIYADLLLRWNRTINLISKADEASIWDRHIDDALELLPLVPSSVTRAIDLGSGGGLPGLVLAIASPVSFELVEADQRKAAFLREAARETGAKAIVHAVRIERLQTSPAALITARALAPLPKLLDLAVPHLSAGGICIFPKGQTVEGELTAAASQWHMRVEKVASKSQASATNLIVSEITHIGTAPHRPAPLG